MTTVTVTSTIGVTCHYWLTPKPIEDTSGLGVTVPSIVRGWIGPNADGSAATLSLELDSAYAWDVDLRFRNAPPIVFQGFQPGEGGDLLTLLSAQGWVGL